MITHTIGVRRRLPSPPSFMHAAHPAPVKQAAAQTKPPAAHTEPPWSSVYLLY